MRTAPPATGCCFCVFVCAWLAGVEALFSDGFSKERQMDMQNILRWIWICLRIRTRGRRPEVERKLLEETLQLPLRLWVEEEEYGFTAWYDGVHGAWSFPVFPGETKEGAIAAAILAKELRIPLEVELIESENSWVARWEEDCGNGQTREHAIGDLLFAIAARSPAVIIIREKSALRLLLPPIVVEENQ